MRTARISGLRRGHLTAGFVPWLRVGSFHGSDSAGCAIITIEPPSSYRLSADPLYIYMCAPCTRGLVLFKAFLRVNFAENSALWRRDRTPRASVKQHRTHKGRSKFPASVSQQLLTTPTELLVGAPREFVKLRASVKARS